MSYGSMKERRKTFKFNVDGADRGKPEPTGIGMVLHNAKGKLSSCFQRMRA